MKNSVFDKDTMPFMRRNSEQIRCFMRSECKSKRWNDNVSISRSKLTDVVRYHLTVCTLQASVTRPSHSLERESTFESKPQGRRRRR